MELALKAVSGCWLEETMTTTIQGWMLTMVTFTSRILSVRAEFRYVLEDGIQKFVMTPGTIRMPLWSADNWDSPLMVLLDLEDGYLVRTTFHLY